MIISSLRIFPLRNLEWSGQPPVPLQPTSRSPYLYSSRNPLESWQSLPESPSQVGSQISYQFSE